MAHIIKSKAEFFEFQLDDGTGDETVYRLPLLTSAKMDEVQEVNSIRHIEDETERDEAVSTFLRQMLEKYCPGAAERMTSDAFLAVALGWLGKNEEEEGVPVGE